MLEPDRSSTRLGEYPGDVEPDETLDGDGGPCCCHVTEPGGDIDWGRTLFTVAEYKRQTLFVQINNFTFGLGLVHCLSNLDEKILRNSRRRTLRTIELAEIIAGIA